MPIISPGSGGSGVGSLVFTSTLGAPAATMDTGANAFPATPGNWLRVLIMGQTVQVAVQSTVLVTVNNDGGANYNFQRVSGANVTAAAAPANGGTSWSLLLHGNSGTTTAPGMIVLDFPAYGATTFDKVCLCAASVPDGTAANQFHASYVLHHVGTAAISRLKLDGSGNNLATGTSIVAWVF